MDSWVNVLGLGGASYCAHTLRRTKATLIYRRTKNRDARDLGIEVNDALELAAQTDV